MTDCFDKIANVLLFYGNSLHALNVIKKRRTLEFIGLNGI